MLAPWEKRYDKPTGGLICFSRVWLCIPVNGSPPGASVHAILQAGALQWVAMPPPRSSEPKANTIIKRQTKQSKTETTKPKANMQNKIVVLRTSCTSELEIFI